VFVGHGFDEFGDGEEKSVRAVVFGGDAECGCAEFRAD
jgi:hypothetical protein